MWEYFDLWKFLAGLGIFLFGMSEMEKGLQALGGKALKGFLRRSTQSPAKAILSGTFATAILQSSSVVTLMLLAFVGAGIINFHNAVGVIFGANLGTTLTGWIVAVFGFSFKIESFALPMIAAGALGQAFVGKNEKWFAAFKLLAGFGFLFLGIDFMKGSIDYLAENVDLSEYLVYGNFAFLVFGMLFTALLQSSSATMVITLSALNAGVIPFVTAGSLVIGANLGTTITVLLGAINGHAAKRRVAYAHLFFNLVTAAIAFPLLSGMVWFINEVLDVDNKLYALTAFHTIFNALGIVVFFPFVKPFANKLDMWIKDEVHAVSHFIHLLPPTEVESGLTAIEKEAKHMFSMVVNLNMLALNLRTEIVAEADDNKGSWRSKWKEKKSFMILYQDIRHLEMEIIQFYAGLQKVAINQKEAMYLSNLMAAIRNLVYSAKSMKDILHNLAELDNEDADELEKRFNEIRNFGDVFFHSLKSSIDGAENVIFSDELTKLMEMGRQFYNQFIATVYEEVSNNQLTEAQVSTLLRVNREIYNSNKFLLRAALGLSMHFDESTSLEEHPVFG